MNIKNIALIYFPFILTNSNPYFETHIKIYIYMTQTAINNVYVMESRIKKELSVWAKIC